MSPSLTRRDAAKILAAAAGSPLLAAQTSDICFLSAREMAKLIRDKKLSAREAMAAHLKQIERVNPKVNAIITLVADQATENARGADEAQAQRKPLGPLHGLPVAHKDLFETTGIRTTFGSLIFKDNVPKRDAIIVERISKAGAITVGKSNTPESGTGSQTFNAVFGSTRNPYDLTKPAADRAGARLSAWRAAWFQLRMEAIRADLCVTRLPFATSSESGLRPDVCPHSHRAMHG
jgi:amidase